MTNQSGPKEGRMAIVACAGRITMGPKVFIVQGKPDARLNPAVID
jgi:hypothetical protein